MFILYAKCGFWSIKHFSERHIMIWKQGFIESKIEHKLKVKELPKHSSKKKISGNKSSPMIKCSCGFEILLVPNVKVMSEAVEAHVAEHQQKIKDPKAAEAEAERIRDDLIMQVFEKASQA